MATELAAYAQDRPSLKLLSHNGLIDIISLMKVHKDIDAILELFGRDGAGCVQS